MVHNGSAEFAPSDIHVACESAEEDEARTRAGWNAYSPKGEVSATYIGHMSYLEYEQLGRRPKE
ncbi:hypothetical protein BKG82_27330 [Mycobacteroides chelonae]|uniref:Uncharacterized protein n=2 Tax=Mycobacteroides chelonae TaxID=1774 RepID=A0A1S1LL83_MYCCH|nr:hypothetical protein BKG82_27330 [Mycobacteroides chelonae]